MNKAELFIILTVSRTTLDVICLTAFGHNGDAVHDADDELATAYREVVNTQSSECNIFRPYFMLSNLSPMCFSEESFPLHCTLLYPRIASLPYL